MNKADKGRKSRDYKMTEEKYKKAGKFPDYEVQREIKRKGRRRTARKKKETILIQ